MVKLSILTKMFGQRDIFQWAAQHSGLYSRAKAEVFKHLDAHAQTIKALEDKLDPDDEFRIGVRHFMELCDDLIDCSDEEERVDRFMFLDQCSVPSAVWNALWAPIPKFVLPLPKTKAKKKKKSVSTLNGLTKKSKISTGLRIT